MISLSSKLGPRDLGRRVACVEDSGCDTAMNVVMTEAGHFIEVQGTAEGAAFDRAGMDRLLDLAQGGIADLIRMQRQALGV